MLSGDPTMTAKVIDFYYDIVCPYAYLASTQLDAFAERNNVTFRWKPVLLGGIFRSIGGNQVPMSSMSAPRARLNMLDMHRWADMWGVPLTMPAAHPRRSVESMRWLTALEGAARIQISRRLFKAYWVDGLDVSNVDVLQEIAVEAGVSSEDMTSADAREGLFQTTAEAVEAGAFGVPAFVYKDELFWGQDRLPILEQALGVAPQVSEATETGAPMRLRFFHDFSSPFSYLAATQIEDVAARHGLEVDWCPILLGALFREIGTPDVPLFEMNEAKRRYMGKDLTDWSQRWRVPFSFPRSVSDSIGEDHCGQRSSNRRLPCRSIGQPGSKVSPSKMRAFFLLSSSKPALSLLESLRERMILISKCACARIQTQPVLLVCVECRALK